MIQPVHPGQHDTAFSLADLVPGQDVSAAGQPFSFRIASWSMFPTIRKGDLLEMVAPQDIKAGDVVVFRYQGSLVCHRVISLDAGDVVRTCGDHSQGEGELIHRRDMVGKVTGVTRRGRRVALAHAPTRSLLGLVRMRIDETWLRCYGRWDASGVKLIQMLSSYRPVRRLAQRMTRGRISLALGEPSPVCLVRAYRFHDLGRLPLRTEKLTTLPGSCRDEEDLILLARLGQLSLGTLSLATGELRVRRLARLLDVQEHLLAAHQSVIAWRAGPRPARGTDQPV